MSTSQLEVEEIPYQEVVYGSRCTHDGGGVSDLVVSSNQDVAKGQEVEVLFRNTVRTPASLYSE